MLSIRRRGKLHERVRERFMHFPRERVLSVHQIIKEAYETLPNPTLSFGKCMCFEANRTQTCNVCVYSREGRPGEETGSVQQATRKPVATLGKESGFLTSSVGVSAHLTASSFCLFTNHHMFR